jgi:hypothetical protein
MSQHEAGKGDAPRKGRDEKAYAEGWSRIFGPKKEPVPETKKDEKEQPKL